MNTLGEAVDRKQPDEKESIEKGDDEAHAELVLEIIRSDTCKSSKMLPVYNNGAWWAYDGRRGIWIIVSTDKVNKAILWLKNVACYTSKDGPKKITLSSGKLKSIYDMMKIIAQDDAFFEEAKPGVSFRNDITLLFEVGEEGKPKRMIHSPMHRIRSYFGFNLESQSECPNWKAFLVSVFQGDEDQEAKVKVLQEFIGAAMRGHATHYEKALLLLGTGRNGKSIFCEVVSQLFENGLCAIDPQNLSDERKRVALDGARLNLVSDMSVRGFKDSGGWKQVVSGDPVSARRLYAEDFVFRPQAAHIYSCNDLPRSPDLTPGFYRRWLPISFNRTFTAEDSAPRKQLLDSLISELPGIAIWALKGSQKVMKRGGYLEPSSSGIILTEWSADNNMVQQFTLTATTKCPDDKLWTEAVVVYEAYKEWAKYNGHGQMSSTLFYSRMIKLGYARRKGGDGRVEYELQVKDRKLWAGGAQQLELSDDLRR